MRPLLTALLLAHAALGTSAAPRFNETRDVSARSARDLLPRTVVDATKAQQLEFHSGLVASGSGASTRPWYRVQQMKYPPKPRGRPLGTKNKRKYWRKNMGPKPIEQNASSQSSSHPAPSSSESTHPASLQPPSPRPIKISPSLQPPAPSLSLPPPPPPPPRLFGVPLTPGKPSQPSLLEAEPVPGQPSGPRLFGVHLDQQGPTHTHVSSQASEPLRPTRPTPMRLSEVQRPSSYRPFQPFEERQPHIQAMHHRRRDLGLQNESKLEPRADANHDSGSSSGGGHLSRARRRVKKIFTGRRPSAHNEPPVPTEQPGSEGNESPSPRQPRMRHEVVFNTPGSPAWKLAHHRFRPLPDPDSPEHPTSPETAKAIHKSLRRNRIHVVELAPVPDELLVLMGLQPQRRPNGVLPTNAGVVRQNRLLNMMMGHHRRDLGEKQDFKLERRVDANQNSGINSSSGRGNRLVRA